MDQPTHAESHTLDPVPTHGSCVKNINIVDFALSGHMAIVFRAALSRSPSRPPSQTFSLPLNSESVHRFCQTFTSVASPLGPSVNIFNSTIPF